MPKFKVVIPSETNQIREYCFIPKQQRFVIRFLSGESFALSVNDLPKKLQSKKPKWEDARLSEDQTYLIVAAGNDIRQIPARIVQTKGKVI